MQSWMESFLSTSTPSVNEIDNALKDFGFYHQPHEVQRMYAEKMNHGTLGYPGAVIDQPDEYWHDMATMRWLELWVKHVKPMPRMEQTSVFDTIRNEGTLNGKFHNGNS